MRGVRFREGTAFPRAPPDGRIPIWSVQPMNVDERAVARELVRHAVELGLVLADGNYDAGLFVRRGGRQGRKAGGAALAGV